jgi:ATP-binding protein involved in chromosome partitioning
VHAVETKLIAPGAVIVSTPQDIALIDAVKGVKMFKKLDLPVCLLPYLLRDTYVLSSPAQILGMVQNMSVFTCPNCQHTTHVFGTEGVSRECLKHGIELLGDIPLDASICQDADHGKPTVVAREGPLTDAYKSIAGKVIEKLWR